MSAQEDLAVHHDGQMRACFDRWQSDTSNDGEICCIVSMSLLSQTLPSSPCLVGSSSPSSICFIPPGRETSWWDCQRLPQWGRVCRTEPHQCVTGKAVHCVSHFSVLWACVCTEKSKRKGTILILQSVQQTWMEPLPPAGSFKLLKELFDH